eukprot:scaffold260989_cov32-Tisochrysis_lutea.AAC.1
MPCRSLRIRAHAWRPRGGTNANAHRAMRTACIWRNRLSTPDEISTACTLRGCASLHAVRT